MISKHKVTAFISFTALAIGGCTVNTTTKSDGSGGGDSDGVVSSKGGASNHSEATNLGGSKNNSSAEGGNSGSLLSSAAPGSSPLAGVGGHGGASYGQFSAGGTPSAGSSSSGTTEVVCAFAGKVTQDIELGPDPACPDGFEVPEPVFISGAGTTLTIAPGTKLKFASGAWIEVKASASLVAVGTADSPITFTGMQKVPGAWGGIVFRSNSTRNQISHAIVEYGAEPENTSAGIVLSLAEQNSMLKLSDTVIRDCGQFGLALFDRAVLAQFENVTITKNLRGAARAIVTSVDQLRGTGNHLTENGEGNMVRIETNLSYELTKADTVWPNLSPAIYRVTGTNGEGGEQVEVRGHLTIEAGAVFEFVGGAGLTVIDDASGLSAIGRADAPIVFRGVDGSGWTGIGFCQSGWTGNALEEVLIANAEGPAQDFSLCGSGANEIKDPSVLVGRAYASKPSNLRMKNVKFSGPNSGDSDILVVKPSTVTLEGTNSGTAADGTIAIQTYPTE